MGIVNKNVSRRAFVAGGAAAAGAMAIGLSGCGGEKKQEGGAAAGEGVEGGTITAALSHQSTAYDPLGNSSALMLPASQHVFESLYGIEYSDYSNYPALAAGDPTKISDTEFEVTLREGAKFSDGTDVTAKDVVASFKANLEDGQLYKAFISFIKDVKAKDDTTVTFTTEYPCESLWIPRLATILIFPAASTPEERAAKPIGSGPWMYDQIDGNDGGMVTFVKNPNYNGPKAPKAEKMEWSVLMDATSRTTAMTEGSVMAMEDVPDANADAVEAAGATIERMDGFCLAFLMFNCIKKPFDDPRVRQAFFYAIDVEKLISNQLNGHATAATSFLPAGWKGYNQASTVFTYDQEKAKSLLKEAGAEGLKVNFRVNANWVSDLGAQIQEDLKAVGLDVTMDVNAAPYDDMANEHSASNPLPFDVFLAPGDPSCFGNDPDLLMSWWYDNEQWLVGRSCWGEAEDGKSKEFKKMLAEARELTGDDQQKKWNECYDFIAEQVPLYPLFHKQMPTAYDPAKIAGFKPISATGLFFLDAACTAESAK